MTKQQRTRTTTAKAGSKPVKLPTTQDLNGLFDNLPVPPLPRAPRRIRSPNRQVDPQGRQSARRRPPTTNPRCVARTANRLAFMAALGVFALYGAYSATMNIYDRIHDYIEDRITEQAQARIDMAYDETDAVVSGYQQAWDEASKALETCQTEKANVLREAVLQVLDTQRIKTAQRTKL